MVGLNQDKISTILQSYCLLSMVAGYEVDIRECEENPENLIARIIGVEVFFEIPKRTCKLPLQLLSDGVYNSVSIEQTIEQMIKYMERVR